MMCRPDTHVVTWQAYSSYEPIPDEARCQCGVFTMGEMRRLMRQPAQQEGGQR